METKAVIIHHAEIMLKGKNRNFFEQRLKENVIQAMQDRAIPAEWKREENRIIGMVGLPDLEAARNILKTMPGVKYITIGDCVQSTVEAILQAAEILLKTLCAKSLSIQTRRSWKEFPLSSVELNKQIGAIAKQLNIPINFENPDVTLTIEITKNTAYLSTERIGGAGGLPVGVSGKVLCLFSGGIDSPVAAWLMMKRGCTVDLLHFHPFSDSKEVTATKIGALAKMLSSYQNSMKLHLVPYTTYDLSTQGKLDSDASLVSFRNIMLRVAEAIAIKQKYRAIVTGDGLAQVASQTLHNIAAAQDGITLPILRPLIAYDKEEIVHLARKIGTYNESVKPYKDCCSIVAGHTNIATRKEHIRKNLERVNVVGIVTELVRETEMIKVGQQTK